MRTAILIDSGCDVSQELVQRYHMKVMHLHIIIRNGIILTGWISCLRPFTSVFREKFPPPQHPVPRM